MASVIDGRHRVPSLTGSPVCSVRLIVLLTMLSSTGSRASWRRWISSITMRRTRLVYEMSVAFLVIMFHFFGRGNNDLDLRYLLLPELSTSRPFGDFDAVRLETLAEVPHLLLHECFQRGE